jgi:hypothetical protein
MVKPVYPPTTYLLLYQHFKDISALEILTLSGSYNFTKIENIKTMVKPLNAYELHLDLILYRIPV